MTGPEPQLVPLPALDAAGRGSFSHDGRVYAVFTVAGAPLVVVDGGCPHRGGPLAEGLVRDGAVVCPWHWYAFDLVTGQCRTASGPGLRRHEVVHLDGVPHARIVPPVTASWSERLRAHARGQAVMPGVGVAAPERPGPPDTPRPPASAQS